MDKSTRKFLKVLTIFILGFVALVTNVEIWNVAYLGHSDGFHVFMSIINFLFEGTVIYFIAKSWLPDK